MKQLLVPCLIALTMFGASAAVSWKLQYFKSAAMSKSTAEDQTATAGSDQSEDKLHGSSEHHSNLEKRAKEPMHPRNTESAAPEPPMPRVAVQPVYSPGVEETVQLASSLRDRTAAVRERETQLIARQKQLELVREDIRNERTAIDELRKQVSDELKAVEEQFAEAQRQRADLDMKQHSIDGRVTEMVGQEKDNIKKMGSVYDNMAPESAAKIIQQMADGGNMDTAVKLLAVMKERKAAKVLEEMSDPSLSAQLSERLRGLKRPTVPAKK